MTYETKCVQVCISRLFVKTKKLHEKAIVSSGERYTLYIWLKYRSFFWVNNEKLSLKREEKYHK